MPKAPEAKNGKINPQVKPTFRKESGLLKSSGAPVGIFYAGRGVVSTEGGRYIVKRKPRNLDDEQTPQDRYKTPCVGSLSPRKY